MSRASHSCREDLDRDQEGRSVRSKVEDELADREDCYESSCRDMIGHAGPDGVQDADGDAGVELLANTADDVGEEYRNVEAGEVASTGDDDVSDGGVPECEEGCLAFAISDLGEDEGLVEVDSVEGDITT